MHKNTKYFYLFRSELQHPVAPCNAILVLGVCSIHILVSDVRQLECCFILDTVVRGHTVQPKYLQIGKESIALVLVFNQREVESEERRLSAINILLTFHTREHGRVVSSGGSWPLGQYLVLLGGQQCSREAQVYFALLNCHNLRRSGSYLMVIESAKNVLGRNNETCYYLKYFYN